METNNISRQRTSSAKQQMPATAQKLVNSSKNHSDLSQISTTTDSNNGEEKPIKRLPPIKAPVGLAKSPDLKNCKSKVGSLNNIKHTPAGGRVIIENRKLQWNAKSKVGSLDNKEHKPAGGNIKVETRKLEWKTESKVQSLHNVNHKPGGGNVKIFNESYREKSTPKKALGGCTTDKKSESSPSPPTSTNSSVLDKSLTKDLKGLSLGK